MPTILDLFLSSSLALTPALGEPTLIVTQPIQGNPQASELVVLVGVKELGECEFVSYLINNYQPEYTAWCTSSLMEND